jgi:hypothetical protein
VGQLAGSRDRVDSGGGDPAMASAGSPRCGRPARSSGRRSQALRPRRVPALPSATPCSASRPASRP